jgi:2-aminobenzoylacetyl-CoA thioesterase
MIDKRYRPIAITENFYQLGTPSFPVYLSKGQKSMIIEGGTSSISILIIEQIEDLGIRPDSIDYLFLTHTHADHVGAVPYLKWLCPNLEVIGNPIAADLLKNRANIREIVKSDHNIAEIMLSKRQIKELPPELKNPVFHIDTVVDEGDVIELGQGVTWKIYNTPGHSSCHTSLFEEKEKIVVIGDATGFYSPEKDSFWPNYFSSLADYCYSIKKLRALPAKKGVLSHNFIIKEDVPGFLNKALESTENYHLEMLQRVASGEDPDKIAMDKAKWVNTLTDDFPFDVMHTLSKILIKRSKAEAHNKKLFGS